MCRSAAQGWQLGQRSGATLRFSIVAPVATVPQVKEGKLRALAVFVLLAALGLGVDFALALAFVCASSAAAVLPVAPAGAAMQAGAGAAILIASGVHANDAVAFGIAAQALLMAAGAAFVLALAAWHAQGRIQQFAVAGQLRRTRTLG